MVLEGLGLSVSRDTSEQTEWPALLDGKTAVITGGASGIGREIAIEFARSGANTVVADTRKEPRGGGKPTHKLIEEETDREAAYVECDVADQDDLTATFEEARDFGELDVLVNNAAIVREEDYDLDSDTIDQLYDVNVKGCLYASRMAADIMDTGCILNISSVEAIAGTSSRPVYGSTRAALRQMTFALADRFSPEIRVNAILPGLIDTEMVRQDVPLLENEETLDKLEGMIPLDRAGSPDEIAKPAVFLASDFASYVTGSELVVDGGLTYTE